MGNPRKVLLVEDDEAIRKVVARELTARGIVVLEAPNGEEALGIAQRERPSCIMLDVLMPKMHGMDMLRKLREEDWGKAIPVILLTNYGDDPRVAEAVRDGWCSLLRKDGAKLEDIISAVTGQLKV
jgi:CheY-like chemotaxis protein